MQLASSNLVVNLGVVFDTNYVAQAITMIESANSHCSLQLHWYAIVLDDLDTARLEKYDHLNINYLRVQDLHDYDYLHSKERKPWNEFCWSSSAVLLHWMSTNLPENEIIGYVDSDCFFLSDLKLFLDLILVGEGNILIHEHNYSPDRLVWLEKSGRFNVGFVAGRNVQEFRRCLSKWRNQVIEDSSINYDKGICGDQKYLDEWPQLYRSLRISKEIGAGAAPWNLNNFSISWDNNVPLLNNAPVIFYHFHGLQTMKWKFLFFYLVAPGYNIDVKRIKKLYIIYLKKVMQVSANIGLEKRHKRFIEFVLNALKSRLLPKLLFSIDWF